MKAVIVDFGFGPIRIPCSLSELGIPEFGEPVRHRPVKQKEAPAKDDLTVGDMIKEYARLNDMSPLTAKLFLLKLPDYLRFQALLRSAAVILDKKYPDHINNAKVDKYYTIDMSNGRVCEVPKSKVKNFRHFAAFRSLEDIKKATKVLRPFIKSLWPNE